MTKEYKIYDRVSGVFLARNVNDAEDVIGITINDKVYLNDPKNLIEELLDALQFCVELLEESGCTAYTARRAIAKAKGERLRISPHGVFVDGVDISQG